VTTKHDQMIVASGVSQLNAHESLVPFVIGESRMLFVIR